MLERALNQLPSVPDIEFDGNARGITPPKNSNGEDLTISHATIRIRGGAIRWLANGEVPSSNNGQLVEEDDELLFMAPGIDYRGPLAQLLMIPVEGALPVTAELVLYD